MSTTKIEWTESTPNPAVGCTKESDGCKNCYAIRMAWRLMHSPHTKVAEKYAGTVYKSKGGELNWTGQINYDENVLYNILFNKKPTMYFVNSMGDLFHPLMRQDFIDKCFAVFALSPQHTFQILTKHPDFMADYFFGSPIERWLDNMIDFNPHIQRESDFTFPLKNVWLGTSVENQKMANRRLGYLNSIEATVKFLSCEPLLGKIDFEDALGSSLKWHAGGMKNCISWVIAGGESGPKARPVHPYWIRSIRDQCASEGVPFFFKQWGEWSPDFDNQRKYQEYKFDDGTIVKKIGKLKSGNLLDGQRYLQLPK